MEKLIGKNMCYLGLSKDFLVIPLKHNPPENCKNGDKLDLSRIKNFYPPKDTGNSRKTRNRL